MVEMDDVVQEFLVESHENLDQLDQDLVSLEQDPGNRQILDSIFRTIHTIKGTCGFLGFSKLESVTHTGENLLSRLREGELELTSENTSALLSMVDSVRQMLACIESSGEEGDTDYSELKAWIKRLYEEPQSSAAMTSDPAANDESLPENPEPSEQDPPSIEEPAELAASTADTPQAPSPASPEPTQVAKPEGQPARTSAGQGSSGLRDTAIRVDVSLLDQLMNLVGELVLARNQVLQYTGNVSENALGAASQRLNMITSELQEGVMKARMQPIGNIWNKFPRVVRDLSSSTGKKIRLEMEGKETELDKTLLEAIKDPLTHLIRNASDHGIETPEKRIAAGKPEEGTLRLRSFHEGGMVNIEIIDDGAGIDPQKIAKKAIEKGMVTPEQVARMSDRDVVNLIMLPGFSTAEAVTNISGRGVGMDVVKQNIDKIGGQVDLQSAPGEGTTVRIKIPLTLAIIPALIVGCLSERFAIPQVNLLELVRLEGERAVRGIEYIQGTPVHRLRGNLLPLVYLSEELGSPRERQVDGEEVANIIVLQAEGRHFGLVVDSIHDTQEIVVKPLGKQLKQIDAFAGATIMGDGHVALILDVVGLAMRAGIISADNASAAQAGTSTRSQESESLETLLVFRVGSEGRLALNLSLVARLEEFKKDKIEYSAGHPVVQYRGEIMPLIELSSYIPERRSEVRSAVEDLETDPDVVQVVVFSEGRRSVGLIVDQILDIVKDKADIGRPSTRDGVLGSCVIQGKVTELLDVRGVIRMAEPEFFENLLSDDSHAVSVSDRSAQEFVEA